MTTSFTPDDIKSGMYVVTSTSNGNIGTIYKVGYKVKRDGNAMLLISMSDGCIVADGNKRDIANHLNLTGYNVCTPEVLIEAIRKQFTV